MERVPMDYSLARAPSLGIGVERKSDDRGRRNAGVGRMGVERGRERFPEIGLGRVRNPWWTDGEVMGKIGGRKGFGMWERRRWVSRLMHP
jgi:hypothetical protein